MGTQKSNSDFADARYRQQAPALGMVGQYQMSAVPYLSSSIPVGAVDVDVPTTIAFSSVTRFVTVTNDATGSNKPLRVGFSFHGVSGSSGGLPGDELRRNYLMLDNGESYTGEWRVSEIFLLAAKPPVLDVNGTPVAGGGALYHATTASVIAGLTGIPHDSLMTNWSGSTGVG